MSRTLIEITPLAERPRERCLTTGAACLSLRECLALILGSGPPRIGCMGLASKILERTGSGMSASDEENAFFIAMETSGESSLKDLHGLGPSGQAKILAAFELGRRYSHFRDVIRHPKKQRDTYPSLSLKVLDKISVSRRRDSKEWLGFVPLYSCGILGELCTVERGVRTHVNTDPTELFARILALRPTGFFLFHNHPSGSLTPSPQDIDLTRKVDEISKKLGIQMLGHWIVTSLSEHWIRPLH